MHETSYNERDPTFSVLMKKSSIALLSSPALLASFLLSVYPAQANTNQSLDIKDGDLYTSSVVITKTNQTTDSNSQFRDDLTNILTSDRIGDLAIKQRGCDCMGCRQAVMSLLSK